MSDRVLNTPLIPFYYLLLQQSVNKQRCSEKIFLCCINKRKNSDQDHPNQMKTNLLIINHTDLEDNNQ